MIRTGVVDLTTIPAIAYRQKLPSGGSGVVIIRGDSTQPGIASISKTSGEAIPAANTPVKLYPKEAFAEAIALTAGMPYKKLGGVKYAGGKPAEAAEEKPEPMPEEVVVDSAEYLAIVGAYTDKKGKLSYGLLNHDLIRFSHRSSRVRAMIAEMAPVENIRAYAVGTKFRDITGNHRLTDAQVQAMVDMLDEVSPKGVLTEFTEQLRLDLKASRSKK